MADYHLDFLFVAEARDGAIIRQLPGDLSQWGNPKGPYNDVLRHLPLRKFSLYGRGHLFEVDFDDASISVDGRKQYAPRPIRRESLAPVYYRTVVRTQELGYEKRRFGWLGLLGRRPKPSVTYTLGWEADEGGKHREFLMRVT